MIAASQARDVADQHVLCGGGGKAVFQIEAKLGGAVQMAAHVGADANVDFGRRSEMEVRVKTGDAVNLIKGSACALGKSFELRFGQKAMAQLDGSQIVEDHGASRVKEAPNDWKTAARRNVRS